MLQVISAQLRKTAEFFMFSAMLSKEKLYDIFDNLQDVVKDPDLFEPADNRNDPLTFNKKGVVKIRSFGIPISEKMSFSDLIKRIDAAISLAAKSEEDPSMKNLDIYLSGAFRQNPNRWYNVSFKGKTYEAARDEALSKVITPSITALEATAKVLERKAGFNFSGMTEALKELHKVTEDLEKNWLASKDEADQALIRQHTEKINKSVADLRKELLGPGK